jgi:L-threonylcarbamoyladenylate synthase
MEILSDSDCGLEKAARALAEGALVAFPTETVYGLGGDAFRLSALARIFEVKNRPRFDPLIIHIADPDSVSRVANVNLLSPAARRKLSLLSERLWPGPLTLILPKRPELPGLATAGLATAAIRFPSHPVAQKLIRLSTGAVAAPSANPFGYLSPTRPEHVINQLGESVDFIIDSGRTPVGVESTVLDLSADMPRILRPGGTSREEIEAIIGPVEPLSGSSEETGGSPTGEAPASPGQLKSHYAPRTPLVLYRWGELASLPETPGEGRLYFSSPPRPPSQDRARVLSENGNPTEAAANLFDMLHELDSLGRKLIRAEEAPGSGLGEAINDRLRKAQQKFAVVIASTPSGVSQRLPASLQSKIEAIDTELTKPR